MGRRFDAFVVFAEMRTGSNHLEESLNTLDDIQCHGELFNPTFIGSRNGYEFLGFDLTRRERDPVAMLDAMIAQAGPLPGFRFFHDHDPRVLKRVLSDARIAKVLLTRNPLDSYVSRKIATATDQWRLTDLKHAKTGKITFDGQEFSRMLDDWTAFRDGLRKGLQVTGQTLFHIRYEDINDVEILNGLARFLGSEDTLSAASDRLKRQNPGALEDKVENLQQMKDSLARIDRFGLDRITDGEGPRAPGASGFVAHPDAGLLFLPVAGSCVEPVLNWMAGIREVGRAALLTGMTQKDLRKWMRTHPGYLSFSLVRHPVLRAFAAFQDLKEGEDDRSAELREALAQRYGVPFTPESRGDGAAMLSFVEVLEGYIKGQTNVRAPASWATQTSLLQAASGVVLPHRIIRDQQATGALAQIAADAGVEAPDFAPDLRPDDVGVTMEEGSLKKAVFNAYRKDYIQFGFSQTDIA